MMRVVPQSSVTSPAPSAGKIYHETILSVRFCEVDSYQIVWHGNYVNYLEVGREAFGKKFGISYQSLIDRGLRAPIIHVEMNYRRSLKYGDRFLVLTEYVEKPQAKICFSYKLTSLDGKIIYCRGKTEQALQDIDTGRTLPCLPDWHAGWLAQAKSMI
ncbi:acyl-CoA thioesterase [Neolewinella agarilytica]|uniref:acyl-CoA thioesterase n=1 Tax=Neolewinella agarilytica TaxID=478744 RepID=UPI0023566E5E|nr:acyl-CoA thioesterase [Neolewinella agarilytica]